MAHFIYNVAPVRDREELEKEQYVQAGPTCWYYAAKMLLRFHDRIIPQAEEEYRQWKALHMIRQMLTHERQDLTARAMPGLVPSMRERLERLKKLQHPTGKVKAKEEGLSQREQKALEYLPEAIAILERYGESLKLDSTAEMRRYGLFRAAFGDALFEPLLEEAYPFTAEGVERALVDRGPLYCGGGLSGETEPGPVDALAEGAYGTTFKFTATLMPVRFGEERHAVAIIGIHNDDSGATVYYRDPNRMDFVFQMPIKVFAKQADVFMDEKGQRCTFLAVRCGMDSGCVHRDPKRITLGRTDSGVNSNMSSNVNSNLPTGNTGGTGKPDSSGWDEEWQNW